jgi:hypothetical protein
MLSEKDTIWEKLDLATFRDGFLGGTLFAIGIQLGIVKIVDPLGTILVFLLLILGIATAINKAFSRGSLISPPWDGVISGFGVVLGIFQIITAYILPHLATS